MVKRFCDLCNNEITSSWYDFNIYSRSDSVIHTNCLAFNDVCDDCYCKIYETISNIKYGNNNESIVEVN